jgi:hypothetical protein
MRIMGLKFKTFSGAAKRAEAERFFTPTHDFRVVTCTKPADIAKGFIWRIEKSRKPRV